jgi:uncharacterized protein (TIGR03118 family)
LESLEDRVVPTITLQPELAGGVAGLAGHLVEFRKAPSGDISGSGDALASADALFALPLTDAGVIADATDNGVAVINYQDTGGGTDFANPRDVGIPPLTAVKRTDAASGGTNPNAPDVNSGTFNPNAEDDEFAMQSSGFLYIPTAGDWTFSVKSDDAERLLIGTDNARVTIFDGVRGPTTDSTTVTVPRPGFYHYQLTWDQGGGGAMAEFFSSFNGGPNTLVGDTAHDGLAVFQSYDQPLTIQGVTVAATEGQSFTGAAATFTDADPAATAADFSATISYGDGTPPVTVTGTTSADGQIVADTTVSGQFDVLGTHTFAEEGQFNVTVTVTDTLGGSAATTAFYTQTNLVANRAQTGGADEVQRITVTGTGLSGTFALTFNGQTTAAINVLTDTAATVQAQLESLVTIGSGNVTVTGSTGASGGTYVVTFQGTLANANQPLLTVTTFTFMGTGANIVTSTDTDGAPGVPLSPTPAHIDGHLVNPWGIASSSTSPFWISDNGAGVSTLYNGSGVPQPQPTPRVVTIPPSPGGTTPAPITGVVFNGSATDFLVSGPGTAAAHFIFATEDGDIAAWNSGSSAVIEDLNVDFTNGPVYKGLAIGTVGSASFLYATNFRGNRIAVFDNTFAPVTPAGNFTDPGEPAGFAPFGIQNINNQLYVTYAVVGPGGKDDVAGPGNGFVDVFDLSGNFVRRVTTGGTLNSPWGLALAPSTFGAFGGDLLVGNFGDGHISAYNPTTGAFLGQLKDANNLPVQIDGLWGLKFGNNNSAGSAGTLFFTAGLNDEQDGLFGSLTANEASTAVVADAPLTISGVTVTATEGQSFTGKVATFTDANPNGVPGDFTAVINWGDGTSSPADGQPVQIVPDPGAPAGQFLVQGTHTFADEGHLNITVTVTDTLGGSAATTAFYTQTNLVANRAQTGGADEVQQVSVNGTGVSGTFTLSFNGQTATIDVLADTAASVQSKLEALSTIGSGNVTVTGSMGASGGTYVVTFQGTLANAHQPLFDEEFVTLGPIGTSISAGIVTDGAPGTPITPTPAHIDGHLVNPWGIASSSTGPFWISDNGAGVSTLYNGSGTPQPQPTPLVVTIPPSPGGTTPAPVTGVVFNGSATDFLVSGTGTAAHFIFATEDGAIAAWNSGTSAVLKEAPLVTATSPVYKGLAIGTVGTASFLYATNFRNNRIDILDTNFAVVAPTGFGNFTDPSELTGFAPFGIQNINNQLFVTYAKPNPSGHDDVAGPGNGFVDVFDLSGNFVRRVTTGGTLNSPWGLALAPSTFGAFGGDLLVGNFGDGHISAYNPTTGAFLGQLTDDHNLPVQIDGLWGLKFGNNGAGGSAGTLFFTAGLNDEQDGLFGSLTANEASTAVVADAPLFPGSVAPSATPFSGVGGTNAAGGAFNALTAFKTTVGGSNNGATASPQTGGFRVITWDGVKLDGTDFNGNTTVIDPNHVVGIPINRFQNVGVNFEEVYAVSGPAAPTDASTFTTVNPSVTNLFKAFSPTETFAMFGENTIDFSFVLASSPTSTPVPAASRGFGAIFLNVQTPNTTSIEYFNGDVSLGKFFVPVGTAGQPEFLGELFNSPLVTRVTLTLGTDVLFSFDGTHFQSGTQADDPANGHNLVVTDDFVFAEPTAPPSTTFTPTEGQSFTGAVGTFVDSNTGATKADFTATIHWGDGSTSTGTVSGATGGPFTVNGTHTYAEDGSYKVTITVQDVGGSATTLESTAQVAEAGITGTPVAITATENTLFSGVVSTFTDAGSDDPVSAYTASIDWGDGHTSSGVVSQTAPGVYAVKGTHIYADEGPFTVTVTFTETGVTSGTATATGTATVKDAALAVVGVAVNGNEFTPLTDVTVATFTHGAGTEPVSEFSATINWGDGTSSSGTVARSGVSYVVTGTHTYTDEGFYKVTVVVSHNALSATAFAPATMLEELLPDGTRGTPNQRFVSELFRNLTGHKVDPGSLAALSGMLDKGGSAQEVILLVVLTPDHELQVVQGILEHYLHRLPVATDYFNEMNAVNRLLLGSTVEQITAAFISSSEYFQTQGLGSNAGFVEALFRDGLGRSSAGDVGATQILIGLAQGKIDRFQAASMVLGTDEYHVKQVVQDFVTYLGRLPNPANPAEVQAVNLLAIALQLGALRDEDVIAILLSTGELFSKTA